MKANKQTYISKRRELRRRTLAQKACDILLVNSQNRPRLLAGSPVKKIRGAVSI